MRNVLKVSVHFDKVGVEKPYIYTPTWISHTEVPTLNEFLMCIVPKFKSNFLYERYFPIGCSYEADGLIMFSCFVENDMYHFEYGDSENPEIYTVSFEEYDVQEVEKFFLQDTPNVKRYRKIPVTISAYQTAKPLVLETLEGRMVASVGDYIITGVNGEQYPCKPDIFEKTYEEVNDE